MESIGGKSRKGWEEGRQTPPIFFTPPPPYTKEWNLPLCLPPSQLTLTNKIYTNKIYTNIIYTNII